MGPCLGDRPPGQTSWRYRVGSTPWGQCGRNREERALCISPIIPKGLPLGDSRTPSAAQVLGVLLDLGSTWFAGKTTALSVMGKNLWTAYFLDKTTSSAWRKVESCPAAKFKTDQLMFPKLFCHLRVPTYLLICTLLFSFEFQFLKCRKKKLYVGSFSLSQGAAGCSGGKLQLLK